MNPRKFKSHLVQAEYEKFLAGERNHYSVLFIDRVIPKAHKFHQPFDLYVKMMQLEQPRDCVVIEGNQNLAKLNEYYVNGEWHFPNRRQVGYGCNDICWGCGKWCVKLEGTPKFYPYVCLIGQFANGNRHPQIPDTPGLRDPIEPKCESPVYPFLCWDCYLYNYKPLTLVRFFGEVYVIDHAFIMNRDRYELRRGPRLRKRIFTRNTKWARFKDVPLEVLAKLNNEGYFVFHELQYDCTCEVSCALCGVTITQQDRGIYLEGQIPDNFSWPVIVTVNGEKVKKWPPVQYIYSCRDCHGEKEKRYYYPFGIKFGVTESSYIND
jgi:hypothetical protein